jgi:hypothetical protein
VLLSPVRNLRAIPEPPEEPGPAEALAEPEMVPPAQLPAS